MSENNFEFLNQTESVGDLLTAALAVLPLVGNQDLKFNLLKALKVFNYIQIPCELDLGEVYHQGIAADLNLTREDALAILNGASLDLKLNHADSIIEYHMDEFIEAQKPKETLRSKSFYGPIIEIVGEFAIQDIGRGKTESHNITGLDGEIQIGRGVEIKYSGGRGTILQASKDVEKSR